MKKHLFSRIHPLLAAVIVVAGVLAVLFGAYGVTRWVSSDEIMGRVEVSGTAIGGLTRDQALSALVAIEDEYLARQARFTIDGSPVSLDPAEAGFDIDEEQIVDAAMLMGREGNAAYQFLWWFRHVFETETTPLRGSTDPDAMTEVFNEWDAEVIAMPASLGAVILEEGILLPVYPEPGLAITRDIATAIIEANLLADDPSNDDLPTEVIVPRLSDADVDAALLEATQLLSDSIRMVYDGSEVVFSTDQLTEAYRSMTIAQGSPQIVHFFDPEVIDKYLTPLRAQFEAEPVNAEWLIVDDDIEVVPGLRGTRIDEEETALKLFQAGMSTGRVGQLPLVEDADPDVTTEYLEGLGVNHLVSSFTTYHACCTARVNNIQLMADTIDMQILLPGEEFSINEFVGERTQEKGYVPAGTIVARQLQDTIGGGVSQFATTMYNAIFWGGYEDIDHKPHSRYFTRYPEGIEATVDWRTPNLIFRNNTDNAILIDTQHTSRSITVRMFGDNAGRTVKGEQTGGRTVMEVVSQGGPSALHVVATVSGRFAFTSPPEPRYEPNPDFAVDQVEQHQTEAGGWSVNVTRRILRGGILLVEEQEWVVRYAPRFAVFEVHPCMVPGQEETCPTTTTTTTTISSTTTTTKE